MSGVKHTAPSELFKEFFDGNEVRPGFGGIGTLKGREYTVAERTILGHFFTNIDSNVYCANDNMPNQLWALLLGQYARTSVTAKERLIQLFEDVHKKEDNVPSVQDLADMVSSGKNISDALESHLTKAGKWIDLYGRTYGHASLRDSGNIGMCFEGVSQRATKWLESAREGAYQEQSTRAVEFTADSLAMPFELRGTEFELEVRELNRKEIELYQEIRRLLPDHISKEHGGLRNEANEQIARELGVGGHDLPDRVWDGVVTERAFDIARCMLPQNITTSLGLTLNTRRLQDQLTEWQSAEFFELQLLGRAAQIEAMKIHPTLMKYGGPSEFRQQLAGRRRDLFSDLVGLDANRFEYKHYDPQSKLIGATTGIENFVLASVLFNGSDGSLSLQELATRVGIMSTKEKRKIAESLVHGKGEHEIHSKVAEIGSLIFERLYDIGAYRDLQRQRGDRQQAIPYTVVGYCMPSDLQAIGLKDRFVDLMGEIKDVHDRVVSTGLHSAAEYLPVMAHVIRHVATKDPVQCFYEAKLRAQAAGAPNYRDIARQEIIHLFGMMSSFDGLIEYDDNDYVLNRLPEAIGGHIRRTKVKLSKQRSS